MVRLIITQARLAFLFVAVAAVLWGTVGVVTRQLFTGYGLSTLTIGFFRLALAVPALAVGSISARSRYRWNANRRDLGLIVLIGVMLALYQICFINAVVNAGVTIATLVTLCMAPVMVAAIDAWLSRQRPSGRELAALAAALAGTMLLVGDAGATGAHVVAGALYALGSALGYAVMLLCSRQIAGRIHPLHSNTLAFGAGALVIGLMTLPHGPHFQIALPGWGLLLYLGLVPTAIGYVLFFRGVRDVPATRASIITLIEPLTAAILAWILFGEQLAQTGWIGAALLVGALASLILQQ